MLHYFPFYPLHCFVFHHPIFPYLSILNHIVSSVISPHLTPSSLLCPYCIVSSFISLRASPHLPLSLHTALFHRSSPLRPPLHLLSSLHTALFYVSSPSEHCIIFPCLSMLYCFIAFLCSDHHSIFCHLSILHCFICRLP